MNAAAPRKPRPSKQARSNARLGAVQALYQMELLQQDSETALREFLDHRLGGEIDGDKYAEADEKFFAVLVRGVVDKQDELDGALVRQLDPDWPLVRLDPILRAALRAAAFELIVRHDVPPRVIIGEYLEIARAFFEDGDEPTFLNGVLDRLARTYRANEMGVRNQD